MGVYFFGGASIDNSPSEFDNSVDGVGLRGNSLINLDQLGIPLAPGFLLDNNELGSESFAEIVRESSEKLISAVELLGVRYSAPEAGKTPILLKAVISPSINVAGFSSIHNIGLNDSTVESLAQKSGEDFAYGEYKQLIEFVNSKFMGVDVSAIDRQGRSNREICKLLLEKIPDFPQDVYDQLGLIVAGLKDEFYSDEINADVPVGLIVQMMLNGNLGENSCFGSCSTRNPISGESGLFGKFSENSFNITDSARDISDLPENYLKSLQEVCTLLEDFYHEVCTVTFVVEGERLWVLDRLPAQTSTRSQIALLMDLCKKGSISKIKVAQSINPEQFNDLLHPVVKEESITDIPKIEGGEAGSPGAGVGRVYFSTKKFMQAYLDAHSSGEDPRLILAMRSTYAEDVKAIEIGQGVISSEGGYASHAPVVARSLGKPALLMPGIQFFEDHMLINGKKVQEGDYVTICISNFEEPSLLLGKAELYHPDLNQASLNEFIALVQELNIDFNVRCNADSAADYAVARQLGAKGIGLCRTEHMFFGERINVIRKMILSETVESRIDALNELKVFQKEDFKAIFKEVEGESVNIRLLDAPLHEFIPNTEEGATETHDFFKKVGMNISFEEMQTGFKRLHEVNPMLGHRGCRIAVSYPEIYEMQVNAVLEAAYEVATQDKLPVSVELMIPLVMCDSEMKFVSYGKNIEDETIRGIEDYIADFKSSQSVSTLPFALKVGSMVEVPAAALDSAHIAKHSQYFSFGTNDLTQTTHGLSRDDINAFLPEYTKFDILTRNPFQILTGPVKELIRLSSVMGTTIRPDLKLGLCGEHGGEPENIQFCIDTGMDYVSCSPYRVPVALLSAVQYRLSKEN